MMMMMMTHSLLTFPELLNTLTSMYSRVLCALIIVVVNSVIFLSDECNNQCLLCHYLEKSVKGFLRGSTPKSAISYTFLNDPYNSSALPCRL